MTIGWIAADWPAPDSVLAGCTTRVGGSSEGGYASLNPAAHVSDRPEHVAANRAAIRQALALPDEPRWLNQVHGNAVSENPGTDVPEADASATRERDVPLAILTADCLPVLFCSYDGATIAAAHGGWRGLAANILAETVRTAGLMPGETHAWLGPAISKAHFEIGAEVRAAFVDLSSDYASCFSENARGRYQGDLYAIARVQLEQAGVTSVHGGGFCTFADEARFYSYRREPACGRMASLVMRR